MLMKYSRNCYGLAEFGTDTSLSVPEWILITLTSTKIAVPWASCCVSFYMSMSKWWPLALFLCRHSSLPKYFKNWCIFISAGIIRINFHTMWETVIICARVWISNAQTHRHKQLYIYICIIANINHNITTISAAVAQLSCCPLKNPDQKGYIFVSVGMATNSS